MSGTADANVPQQNPMNAKVLVVDDTPQNIRLLEAVLTSRGFAVSAAASGAQALDSIANDLPDLVLLDIQMSGMNGYEVVKRLRADPATEFLPVVMITSSGDEERVTAIEAGADDFIPKPFNQAELLARVRSLVRIKQFHDTIQSQTAELAELNRTLEQRVAEQVDELERVGRLRRFLSPQLAEAIVADESVLESHRREIAVLFCDLRGWTQFTSTTEPEEVMSVIRDFHVGMGALIHRFEATVGFFQGDGIMVWFNDPVPVDNPAKLAVELAVEMRSFMADASARWRKRGHELDFGVGVALGYATIGRIGFEGRYDYGAVGSVMNMASRLCDEADGGEILVNSRIHAETEGFADVESAGELVLKGFAKPIEAFRIVSIGSGGPA
jgi:DNA-binding response OmpR family regulator